MYVKEAVMIRVLYSVDFPCMTLPLQEEEPLESSYAAAEGWRR